MLVIINFNNSYYFIHSNFVNYDGNLLGVPNRRISSFNNDISWSTFIASFVLLVYTNENNNFLILIHIDT